MSEELKPCPWGRDHKVKPVKQFLLSSFAGYRVGCCVFDCQASGPFGLTEAEAIAAWNTRHQPEGE